MPFYLFYWVGYVGCLLLPRRFCYWVACRLADFCYLRFDKDRVAVEGNLAAVLKTDQVPPALTREVFRNFSRYLVDFFRFSHLDSQKVRQLVRVEGLERMKAALDEGRGAIGLTAHLGNYELAGAVLALLGLPVNAVVLTHQNPRVDAFFTRQRARVGVQGIPIRGNNLKAFLEASLSALRRNEILALVGDRDFFNHGITLPFFGRSLKVPTGPAAFSLRTGAPIVPGFLIRESDGSYRFILESPIFVPNGVDKEKAQRQIIQSCLEVMARYIRQYPTQWYMFQEFWRPGPAIIQ